MSPELQCRDWDSGLTCIHTTILWWRARLVHSRRDCTPIVLALAKEPPIDLHSRSRASLEAFFSAQEWEEQARRDKGNSTHTHSLSSACTRRRWLKTLYPKISFGEKKEGGGKLSHFSRPGFGAKSMGNGTLVKMKEKCSVLQSSFGYRMQCHHHWSAPYRRHSSEFCLISQWVGYVLEPGQ